MYILQNKLQPGNFYGVYKQKASHCYVWPIRIEKGPSSSKIQNFTYFQAFLRSCKTEDIIFYQNLCLGESNRKAASQVLFIPTA